MMKLVLSLCLFFLCAVSAIAQVMYYDASAFPVYGKITEDTETRYERLPKALKSQVRERLWFLGTNSAGLYIRFSSNSKSVHARWKQTYNTNLNHMTSVGVKGLDLYAYQDRKWKFVNSGRPTSQYTTTSIIENMDGEMRDYMLYLPLYDGIEKLEIGVDSLAYIEMPCVESPQVNKPVVFYGTSITQGACASRPGMAPTNILARKLNRQVINLGFSGNGQLDYEIAHLMADTEASVFVLDFVPNVTVSQIQDKTENFVNIIRAKNPSTPIIIVGSILFPHARFDQYINAVLHKKNSSLEEVLKQMGKKGVKKIYYIHPDDLIGLDGESTVDGIHLTDLGFMRYVDKMYPIIRKYLNK